MVTIKGKKYFSVNKIRDEKGLYLIERGYAENFETPRNAIQTMHNECVNSILLCTIHGCKFIIVKETKTRYLAKPIVVDPLTGEEHDPSSCNVKLL